MYGKIKNLVESNNMQKEIVEKPIYFYMANLWSEVEKIFIWKERKDKEAMQSALRRAIPIIEKIKSFNNKSASFEASILEDILIDLDNPQRKYLASREELSSYLNHFALRLTQDFH
jgi:acetamidase/formamidase